MKKIFVIFCFAILLSGCSGGAVFVKDVSQKNYSDEFMYVNKNLGFKAKVFPDFKLARLSEGNGIVMRKWMSGSYEDIQRHKIKKYDYAEEISVSAVKLDGSEGIKTITDFVQKRYSGYNVEYFGDGVFIDQNAGGDIAVRHFFLIGKNKDFLYELYLKVPSRAYSTHKKEFEEFVKGFELL
ncbi:membrane lipoprotein lipid attachment site-containing protein [Candidatus Peregrinibacteria bacterium]|nr:membrane lipoprotein lipid attachment site-containing protein [Candidatus Peregrinibacteria bacterium]